MLMGGDGRDTLFGGHGANDSLFGGDGNDVIIAGNGAHQFVDGGNGNDTIFAGSGGDTLFGDDGNDEFHITSHTGNNTIDGGDGHNVVSFDTRATTDIASVHSFGGVTVVSFHDGQSATMTHIQDIEFTDKDIKL